MIETKLDHISLHIITSLNRFFYLFWHLEFLNILIYKEILYKFVLKSHPVYFKCIILTDFLRYFSIFFQFRIPRIKRSILERVRIFQILVLLRVLPICILTMSIKIVLRLISNIQAPSFSSIMKLDGRTT